MDILKLLDTMTEDAIAFRRDIHRHPELGFEETRTTEKLLSALRSYEGVEILPPLLETGVIAIVRGKKPGQTTMVRADIDALPMTEDTGLPFSSETPGKCHSCGHDIHTAAVLLTCRAAAAMREELPGTMVFVFQPCEERFPSGAHAFFKAGFEEKVPHLDECLGIHTAPGVPVGKISLIKGAGGGSADGVHIEVCGPGGHGAHPESGIDTVAIAAYIITELQTVISRENYPVTPAVLTFGSIHGGSASNIFPTKVVMEGSLRTLDDECRLKMFEAIRRVATLGGQAMRADVKVEFEEGVPVGYNDPEMCDRIAAASGKILGEDSVVWKQYPSMGSDDFPVYRKVAPGVQFSIGTSNDDPATLYGIHNPKNVFDEGSIRAAAAVLLQYQFDRG